MLDDSIDRLERRLSTRIDSDRAWDYFNADTNSAVISRYTRIYIEGSQSSGQPARTAEMVSRTVGSLLSLRRRRSLSANTMRGVALGLLIACVTSLNVTISIVMRLGDSIAGIATTFTENSNVDLAQFGAQIALPIMDDASGVSENIRLFKIIVSILILFQVWAVSIISNRLRGGGMTTALGQSIQLLWIAGITSYVTSLILESAAALFNV
jgi:flagellar protein FlaJ